MNGGEGCAATEHSRLVQDSLGDIGVDGSETRAAEESIAPNRRHTAGDREDAGEARRESKFATPDCRHAVADGEGSEADAIIERIAPD